MTHYEAALRQLSDNEKHHERAIAKLEMQIRLLGGYRDELEDRIDIAAEMLAAVRDCSKDLAAQMIDDVYEVQQLARTLAVEA